MRRSIETLTSAHEEGLPVTVLERPAALATRARSWQWPHEIGLVVLACLAYTVLCATAPIRPALAHANARDILALETAMGIDVESGLNAWLMARPLLADAATLFYTVSFFAGTILALAALWCWRRDMYAVARNGLFIMTAGAAVTYWTYPLAPPRLLADTSFVDTVARSNDGGDAYTRISALLANQYGAMPSMHTGWALWVALTLGTFLFAKNWQRIILALYPLVTMWVIIATANHYVLDVVAGGVYCLAGLALALVIDGRLSLPGRPANA